MNVPPSDVTSSTSASTSSLPRRDRRGARILASCLGAALPVALAHEVVAQQTPPAAAPAKPQEPRPEVETQIPEVLVEETALQADAALQKVPLSNTAGRDVLSPEEVSQAGAMNVQEVLRRSPSVNISEETGSDSLPNVAIRGVSGNDGIFRSVNVAMFADGIPLSGGPYGAPGASGFPLLMERIYAVDLQRGGGATRYGPNNVSGIVNFLTRPIPEQTTLELRSSYDSFDNGSLYAGIGGSYGRFGFLAEGVYKDGDTYRDHGDYELENYSLKLRYDVTDELRSFTQVEFYDDDSDLSDGLSKLQFQQDRFQSTSLQNRFTANQKRFNQKFEWQTGKDTRVDLIGYYYETERTFYLGSPLYYGDNPTYVQATPRPMNTWAVQPQLSHKYAWGDVDAEVLVGYRFHHENLTRRVERDFPNGTHTLLSDDDFEYVAHSLFAQNDFWFGDFKVTPGVRFERVDMTGKAQNEFEVERDYEEVLPAISASYEMTPQWSVYANVQSSFQPPAANAIELSADPQEIEAQRAWMYEVGTRVQKDDRLVAADLTLYQIDYSDRLEPDPDQFDVLLNSGRSRHRGVELTFDGELEAAGLEGVSYWTSTAYNQSEYENGDFEGNDLPGTPHWLLGWGARYDHEATGLWTAVDGFFTDESYSDRENTEELNDQGTRGIRPSAIVWNAHVGLRRMLGDRCRFDVQVDARNVFDQDDYDVRAARGIYPGAPFGYGATVGFLFTF